MVTSSASTPTRLSARVCSCSRRGPIRPPSMPCRASASDKIGGVSRSQRAPGQLPVHLPDPPAALDRMVAARKPGGWLVSEEADWGLFAIDGHPDAAWATALVHDLFARHAEAGVRVPYFGRHLPGLVASYDL